MAFFIARQNCEFSVRIEADTEEEASLKAVDLPIEEFDRAWSPLEVEPEC